MNQPPQIPAASAPGRTPVIFGEVLFDCFPDGRKVLGGAPFNVAWNLRGLGFTPFFVSAVGDDDLGRQVRRSMDRWGMEPDGVTTLADYPTGQVAVTLSDGQPSYEIKTDQAYDHAPPPDLAALADRPGLLYHGSLIYRNEDARASLRDLIQHSRLPRFVDINIRQPHFDLDWMPELLGGATWIKLNNDELELLSGVTIDGRDSIPAGLDRMRERYGDATFLITCGGEGAYVAEGGQLKHVPAPPPAKIEDTVGAGDSFAAAVIAGILLGKSMPDAMADAVRLASRVCGLNGATSEDPSIYQNILS